jgi:iron complex outermembrane receptor protein
MKNKFKFYFIISFAFIWVLSFPLISFSQDDLLDLSGSADDEMMLFEEIPSVYGASKYEQKITEAPSSISIITSEEIEKYGYRNLAEILQSVRGFYITNDRNYQYVAVRGFGLPEDYDTRLLILVDGHRMKDNIYTSSGVGNEFIVDIDLIDRVEIVRGPSSSIYGTSAFFAVINIFTKKGRDYKGFEVDSSIGTHETYETSLRYGNKFQNGLEVLLSGTYADSEGDHRLYYREFDSRANNNGYAKDLDNERNKKLFAELLFRDIKLQGAYYYRKKDIPTAAYDMVFNQKPAWTVDESYYIDLSYDKYFDNQLSVQARVNYNYYKYYGEYAYDWDEHPWIESIVPNRDTATGQWLYGEIQATKFVFEKHRITAGMDYQYDLEMEQTNYDNVKGDIYKYLDDDHESWHLGMYLQDEFEITEKWILSSGLRYDYYETFGSSFNPRVALIYSPFQKTALKLIYGTAFRAPNAFEAYYHDGNTTSKANPGLDEETIQTYEFIWEQYFGNHVRGTAVGFYYEIKDLITQTRDSKDRLLVYKNTSQIDAYGLELELAGKWANGIENSLSYTYQRTKNRDTGRILSNSPKHLAKLNFIFPIIKEKLFLGLEEQYTSTRNTLFGGSVDEYFLTNLTLFGKNLVKGWDISAGVYNLFDRKYDDPGAEEHIQAAIEQDGRTYRLKVTYSF